MCSPYILHSLRVLYYEEKKYYETHISYEAFRSDTIVKLVAAGIPLIYLSIPEITLNVSIPLNQTLPKSHLNAYISGPDI